MKVTDANSTHVSQTAISSTDSILTVEQVARELKCSKSHVYNIINNRVAGVKPLPVICLGRKKLVRRSSFEAWKRVNEANTLGALDATIGAEPEINTVDA